MSKLLINTLYYSADYKSKQPDRLYIITKDTETGKKEQHLMINPEYEFYITKPEYWLDKPVDFIHKDKVDKFKCSFGDKIKAIATILDERTGKNDSMRWYNACMSTGNRYKSNQILLTPNVHSADMHIEDYYISKFLDKYPIPSEFNLTKGYFDIEVDSYEYEGFPSEYEAPQPIISIAYVDDANNKVKVYCLDIDSDSYVDFKNNVDTYTTDIIKDLYDELKLEFTVDVEFYDDEVEMLRAFFNYINETKPDFIGSWNSHFDILTIINRLAKLSGYDTKEEQDKFVADIICHKDFLHKRVHYYDDKREGVTDIADKGDTFTASSYSNYVDQMLIFASLRKTQGKRDSYSLDAISGEELGVHKIKFTGKENIRNIPYLNYFKFIKYNIRDSILLKMLEDKSGDINQMYFLGTVTRTRVTKVMKKTTSLKNFMTKLAYDNDYIISDNHNATYGDSKPKSKPFRGAFVADPNLNNPNGIIINGKPAKFIFEFVIDEDFSSLYPSIIQALNISRGTQYGKLYIYDEEGNDIAHEFIDHIISDDPIYTAKHWFNLPGLEEVMLHVDNMIETTLTPKS